MATAFYDGKVYMEQITIPHVFKKGKKKGQKTVHNVNVDAKVARGLMKRTFEAIAVNMTFAKDKKIWTVSVMALLLLLFCLCLPV